MEGAPCPYVGARSCWTHEAVSEGRWWGGWGRADEILVSMMEGGQTFFSFIPVQSEDFLIIII